MRPRQRSWLWPARVATAVVALLCLSCSSGDDEDRAAAAGQCGAPGASCTANADCCQLCECEGSGLDFAVTFRSCGSSAAPPYECQSCEDYCLSKKVVSSASCSSC